MEEIRIDMEENETVKLENCERRKEKRRRRGRQKE